MLQQVEVVKESAAQKLTSPVALNFHVSNLKSALASAIAVAIAGNRVVLDLGKDGSDASYIENKETGEKMLKIFGRSKHLRD
jgi:hypothetical protein